MTNSQVERELLTVPGQGVNMKSAEEEYEYFVHTHQILLSEYFRLKTEKEKAEANRRKLEQQLIISSKIESPTSIVVEEPLSNKNDALIIQLNTSGFRMLDTPDRNVFIVSIECAEDAKVLFQRFETKYNREWSRNVKYKVYSPEEMVGRSIIHSDAIDIMVPHKTPGRRPTCAFCELEIGHSLFTSYPSGKQSCCNHKFHIVCGVFVQMILKNKRDCFAKLKGAKGCLS